MMAERETQTRRPHRAKRSLLSFLLALALAAGALVGVTAPAGAAGLAGHPGGDGSSSAPLPLTGFTPPTDPGVAIAEMATVRLVADYTLTYQSGVSSTSLPTTAHCTGEGVVVASITPNGTQGKIVVLTDNTIIGRDLPCLSDLPLATQTALRLGTFKSLTVYLNTAFSGTTPLTLLPQLPSDPSAELDSISGTNLTLLTLPLPAGTGAFQDEPTIALQSAASGNAANVLNLTNSANVSLASKDLNQAPAPGKQAPDASQFATPQARPFTNSTAGTTPGTPVIDNQTGELVSMIDSNGKAVPASAFQSSLADLASSCPQVAANCLGNRWQQVMQQYYPLTADKKGQAKARTALRQLASDYSATFKGAQDFVAALQPSTTPAPTSFPTNTCPTILGVCDTTAEKIALGVLIVLVVLTLLMAFLMVMRRVRRRRASYEAQRGRGRSTSGGQRLSLPSNPPPALGRSTSGGQHLNLPPNPPPVADADDKLSMIRDSRIRSARPPAEPAPAPKPPAPVIAPSPPAGKPEPVAAEPPAAPPGWQNAPTLAGAQAPPVGPVVSPVIPATWHYAPTVQKPLEKPPEERPVFCPECGLQQAPGAAVCPRCGFKVGEALTRFQGRRSQVVPAPAPAPPPAPTVQTVREPGYTQREVREGRGPKRLLPGTELQRRYRIERAVAQGGMGAVYRAVDQHFKRPCAVKEMLDHFSKEEDREQALQWFEREAHLLLDLHHPAIPRVFDYFSEADQQYLVMEFVEGRTLAEVLKQDSQPGGLPEARVRAWATQLCNVLAYLHRLKPPVIFRDLKPANVMVTAEDTVKLIDFGIARSFQEGGQATVIMTIGYAPPEQMEGRPQPQSDLYALGSTLYRLLTGHEARDNQPTIFDFPPLRSLRSEVSPPFAEIIHKALKKNLDERWPSASEMEQALLHLPPLPADTAI